MAFVLHPRLAADCIPVGELPLCSLLLMNDANYPWFILVPRRADVREIHHLPPQDRHQLLAESCALAEAMEVIFKPVKMNVAALGNMVPQLHMHHIARFAADPAWPQPVWGRVPAKAYGDEGREQVLQAMRPALAASGLRC